MAIKFIKKEEVGESYRPDGTATTCYWFDVHDSADYAIQEVNGGTTLINWNREDCGTEWPLYDELQKLTHTIKAEQEIIKLRREGKTAAEIKAATGLSYYRQRQIYESYNIPAPSRYGATRRRILELLDAGEMNQSEIARTLGVSRQLVSEVKQIELKKEVDA